MNKGLSWWDINYPGRIALLAPAAKLISEIEEVLLKNNPAQ
jgi:hypothetical protein